jgi:hypothetical protein
VNSGEGYRVDLAEVGEVRYGDKAYSGAKTKGYDASMKRAARGHPLGISDISETRGSVRSDLRLKDVSVS